MSNPTAADITFRDLAALRAMQAYVAKINLFDDTLARMSYDLADAMVNERTRRMETSEDDQ